MNVVNLTEQRVLRNPNTTDEAKDADAKILASFRDKDHARQVWDDWDCISADGEDAHRYLNLIGDGEYCAV